MYMVILVLEPKTVVTKSLPRLRATGAKYKEIEEGVF